MLSVSISSILPFTSSLFWLLYLHAIRHLHLLLPRLFPCSSPTAPFLAFRSEVKITSERTFLTAFIHSICSVTMPFHFPDSNNHCLKLPCSFTDSSLNCKLPEGRKLITSTKNFRYMWKEGSNLVWSYDKPKQHIKKQRHHFADKGPYSQSCGFSSSHV